MVSIKPVTAPMKLSFLRMLKNYYKTDDKGAAQKYQAYQKASEKQKRFIRPLIVDAWNNRSNKTPPFDDLEEDRDLEEETEEIQEVKPKKAKWNKKTGIKVSTGYLNLSYVHAKQEEGSRFIPVDKKKGRYYDTDLKIEITRHKLLVFQGKRKGSYP